MGEHDVTCICFNCLRLLLSHSFLQFRSVAAQHADPSGMEQSSESGSLILYTSMYTKKIVIENIYPVYMKKRLPVVILC